MKIIQDWLLENKKDLNKSFLCKILIFNKDDKCLIVRNGNTHNNGCWDLPTVSSCKYDDTDITILSNITNCLNLKISQLKKFDKSVEDINGTTTDVLYYKAITDNSDLLKLQFNNNVPNIRTSNVWNTYSPAYTEYKWVLFTDEITSLNMNDSTKLIIQKELLTR